MRFYTLEEKKPEYGEKVLAKIHSYFPVEEEEFDYYVVCRTISPVYNFDTCEWEDQEVYEEAMGEQYSYWKEKDIVGWTSFNEIKKAEEWQESTIKNNSEDDCTPNTISFKEMMDNLGITAEDIENAEDLDYSIELFINKPCVSAQVCEHDKNKVLDKIRAEICKKHLSIVEKNDFDSGRTCGYEEVLNIIDKYKAESEG